MRKIVAVGDIHGDARKLGNVLAKLRSKVDFRETPFVFLGDNVDGGIQTNEVVDTLILLKEMYPHWTFLYGNHEDLMLNALKIRPSLCQPWIQPDDYYLWYNQGGRETIESYMSGHLMSDYERAIAQPKDFIPPRHVNFLCSMPVVHETTSFLFAHAGLKPHRQMVDQTVFDLIWIRDEFIDSDYDWGKRVVFGHTYHPEPLVHPNKIGIDTMHHGHGVLTAAILDDDTGDVLEFVQSYKT